MTRWTDRGSSRSFNSSASTIGDTLGLDQAPLNAKGTHFFQSGVDRDTEVIIFKGICTITPIKEFWIWLIL